MGTKRLLLATVKFILVINKSENVLVNQLTIIMNLNRPERGAPARGLKVVRAFTNTHKL